MNDTRLITLGEATQGLARLAACGPRVRARRDHDLDSSVDRDRTLWPESDALIACGVDSARSSFDCSSSELASRDQEPLGDVGRGLTHGQRAHRAVLVSARTHSHATWEYDLELAVPEPNN